jgi:hypothetical protein
MNTIAARLAGFGIACAATCILFLNFCNWVFRCGCASLWSGAADHCNIHMNGVHHCPFCAHGTPAYSVVLALILIPQFCFNWWLVRLNWFARLTVSLLAFPSVGLAIAAVMGWLDGYWL